MTNPDTLAQQARGDISPGELQKDPAVCQSAEFEQWSPGDPPIEYLQDGEQPHYLLITPNKVIKTIGTYDGDLSGHSRMELKEAHQWSNQTGQQREATIGGNSQYPNIVMITNQRILVFIADGDGDSTLEFDYEESDVRIDTIEATVVADKIEYQILPLVNDASKLHYVLEQSLFEIADDRNMSLSLNIGGSTSNEDTRDINSADELSSEVNLSDFLKLTPKGFENYVADLWGSQGYSCKLTPDVGDSGVDIVAEKDSQKLVIQAKRYSSNNVGVQTVQRVAGLLVDNEFDPTEAVIVTTSDFTKDALSRAKQIDRLTIINGSELTSIANEAGVGTATQDGKPAYDEEVTGDKIFSLVTPGEPMTTEEIASRIKASRQSTVALLEELANKDKLEAKQIEDRMIWYRP